VFEAICAGACGYLLKETPRDRLLAAIRELREGGAPMDRLSLRMDTMRFHIRNTRSPAPTV